MKRWTRAVPALLVAALLVFAIVASSRRAGARAGAAANAYSYPGCSIMLQEGGSGSLYTIGTNTGITQPLGCVGNVAACSLNVQSSFTYSTFNFVQWDPTTLAPDPTTVTLRTRSFNPSDLQYNHLRVDYNPPIIVRHVSHMADPPAITTAMDYVVTTNAEGAYFDNNGSPDTPTAYAYIVGLSRVPLAGGHPLLGHAVCGGDDALQSLYVVQSVMTTSSLMDSSSYDLIQRFRVPVPTKLHWLELAFGPVSPHYPIDPGLIAIIDAQGVSTPPRALPPSLVEAYFLQYGSAPGFWGSHYDFDQIITLQPNHDYWMLVRVAHDYGIFTRSLTGGESADFNSGIGPFFTRSTSTGIWNPLLDRALSFRLIGEPLVNVSVPPSIASPASFNLRVMPNPSRGPAFVTWSGSAGALKFDVFDARGSRVGEGTGTTGRWLWNATADDGRLLPAGVYFLRATDGGGHVATSRVVLVR